METNAVTRKWKGRDDPSAVRCSSPPPSIAVATEWASVEEVQDSFALFLQLVSLTQGDHICNGLVLFFFFTKNELRLGAQTRSNKIRLNRVYKIRRKTDA
jgi:hypothetical protein